MEKIYLDDNLWLIKNFILPEELSLINKVCKDENNWPSNSGEGQWQGNKLEVFNFTKSDEASNLKTTLKNICQRTHDVFDTDNIIVDTNLVILRFVANPNSDFAMNPHHDMSTKYTTHGLVIYYNDDFDGGNIEYPKKGISVKPEPGMLICHPANSQYVHQVSKVISGIRYMSTFFAYQKEFFNLNPEERSLAFKSFDRNQEY